MISIREWTQKDLPVIAVTERACFEEPWTLEMLRSAFAREDFFGLLAEEDDKVVGYICGTVLFEDGELPRVAVLESNCGRGIGGRLVDGLLARAKALGAKRVFLEVRVSNEAALGLYKSRGFEKTRLRKRYYADGEDALEMKAELYAEE